MYLEACEKAGIEAYPEEETPSEVPAPAETTAAPSEPTESPLDPFRVTDEEEQP